MKANRSWPLLITAALAFTVGVNLVMLFAAGADPNGSVVEPDYYRKAVEWDSTMARRAASDRLGWTAQVSLGEAVDGMRPILVVVRDSLGMVVQGATVSVTLIHNLEASQPVTLSLHPVGDDGYSGRVPAPRPGRWEVRVDAQGSKEHFLATLHAEAP